MSLRQYEEWIQNAALPFRFSCAEDSDGLFYETLTLYGIPDDSTELRIRTGFRQIYVFAEAGHLELVSRKEALNRRRALWNPCVR